MEIVSYSTHAGFKGRSVGEGVFLFFSQKKNGIDSNDFYWKNANKTGENVINLFTFYP